MLHSPLAYTSSAFATTIEQLLGKGRQHAEMLYTSWLRYGRWTSENPAFKNAQQLFEEITSLTDRTLLPIVEQQVENDTIKLLLRTSDGLDIETVLIPMQSGSTLCVSSQIGCRMGCAFCETGKMGLLRNLQVPEITAQLFAVRHLQQRPVRNIVFMGMGEPFDNYEHVMQAVRIFTDPKGFGLGKRQITLSTSGCIEGIYQLAEAQEDTPNLAVSLSAPTDELRNKLMPINRKTNLQQLYQAMQYYGQCTKREILIAYVALKDVNDSLEQAQLLANYLQGLAVKINIIPYNAQKRDRFAPSDNQTIEAFSNYLRQKGYYTLIRRTKGRDIMAACGQLGNVEQRKRLHLLQNSSK